MLKNYLLLAVKNLRKHRLFSLINILGLTTGITCCLLIFLFVLNEFSFDRFHKNSGNIYRVMRVSHEDGSEKTIPWLSPPYAAALRNDYPDLVQKTVRVMPDNDLVSYNNISFNEHNIYLADTNFFDFFSFRLLKGDPAAVLRDPLSIVMTESTAKKYFGREDPIGKVVDFNEDLRLKVTGIAADVPANSHLDFDMVVPTTHWQNDPWFNQWKMNGLFAYIQLNPAADPARLKKLFPAFMDKYMGEYYRESGFKMDLSIQPLKDIHFSDGSGPGNLRSGNKKMVYIFMSIALLVLIIACINFINLATAKAADRSKEVGLRKVMGALRGQLAWQFILESMLFAVIASIAALLLLQLIMPAYNQFLGYELPSYWRNPLTYIFTGAVILVVGLVAGSYPALMLSSFKPVESLKGKWKTGKQGSFFRKTLVVFQFGISVMLIICVTIVIKQMHYVQNADLGFDKEQSMIVRLDNGRIWEKKNQFRDQVLADPAVLNVAIMSGEPGGFHDGFSFETEATPGQTLKCNTEFADFEYARTLGLKIIAGRDFSPAFSTDSTRAVLVNRTAAVRMGYTPDQAVGKWVKNLGRDSVRQTIIGVVEDYHFASLKEPIAPLVISSKKGDRRLALIKLQGAGINQAINRIRKAYGQAAPGFPFEYDFLDSSFSRLYRAEAKQEALLSIFSIMAILIACLGLFGLASYTAVKRTREIGIRKVIGSSVSNIILLLSKDLLKPVLIGTVIAIPAGYIIMQKWLQGFTYRASADWWLFALASLIAICIAIFTVSFQAIRAALANPVKSLRTE